MSAAPAQTTASLRTRRAIEASAELLFAERGVEAVTLREIARAAGQRNVAAVQYHFGGKEPLVAAILDRHQREIDAHRDRLLEDARATGQELDLDALLRTLVEPLASKLDDPSGRAYLRMQSQRRPDEPFLPATRSMVERFRRSLGPGAAAGPGPGQGPEEAPALQHRFAILLLFHALAERAGQEAEGAASPPRDVFVRGLERALRGILAGPAG